jgi:hypothetical protein
MIELLEAGTSMADLDPEDQQRVGVGSVSGAAREGPGWKGVRAGRP